MTTVFVSGANGYVGEWIVKQLIEKDYKVVGTVRSADKGETLKRQLASKNFEYEIVSEIGAPNAFDDALKKHKEVTVFIHSASPVILDATDPEKDVLIPAVHGVKNALTAIKTYGPQIKKVVLTSSGTAHIKMEDFTNPDAIVNEDSWNPMTWEQSKANPQITYSGSKALAEKAAWEFVKNEKPNFTLNSVSPYVVVGPEAFDLEGRTKLKSTADRLYQLIYGECEDFPMGAVQSIDIRDVARAHIFAFESDVTNTRFMLANELYVNQDILDIINENIPALKGKVKVGTPGKGIGKDFIGKVCVAQNFKTQKTLGPFISFKQSVIDAVNQILASNSSSK